MAAALDSALETSGVVVGELLSVPTVSLATGARIARAVLVSPTATDESVGAVGTTGCLELAGCTGEARQQAAALSPGGREGYVAESAWYVLRR